MTTTKEIAPHAIVKNIREVNYVKLPKDYYLNLALFYAQHGFWVFPLQPNKYPFKDFKWTKRASNNSDEIIRMWQEYPNGVPAFYCLKSGVVVLDTDNKPYKGKYGFNVLTKLVSDLGMLPKTVMVYTQSFGTHMYFKLPANRSFLRKYENCIDIQVNAYCLCGGVQGDKGYYRFAEGYTFEDIGEIPKLPVKWVEFLSKKNNKPRQPEKTFDVQPVKRKLIEGNFQELYNNCQFCKYCVDYAHILDEVSWFKFAVILSRLKNGFEIFDYYSKPHPEYSLDKTQAKFNNATNYRLNCETIAIDFQGCKECKYNKNKGE